MAADPTSTVTDQPSGSAGEPGRWSRFVPSEKLLGVVTAALGVVTALIGLWAAPFPVRNPQADDELSDMQNRIEELEGLVTELNDENEALQSENQNSADAPAADDGATDFVEVYSGQHLTITAPSDYSCGPGVDLDEPRAAPDDEDSVELFYDACEFSDGPVLRFPLFSDVRVAETTEATSAQGCADAIRRASLPDTAQLVAAPRTRLCIQSRPDEAEAQGRQPRLVLFEVLTVIDDWTIEAQATAWEQR
jgi:hypothetical protein